MKKNLVISALIVALGFSSTICPMTGIAKYLTKEYLKKGIEKGTTGLHWAIAAGPIWGVNVLTLTQLEKIKKDARDKHESFEINGKYSLGDNFYSKQEYLEQIKKQEDWMRQEIKLLGYNDWEKVDISPSFLGFYTFRCLRSQTLLYEPYEVSIAYGEQHQSDESRSFLNWLFNRKPQVSKEKYNELRGIISHELSHLKNRDSEKAMAIGFTMPFITHLLTKKISGLAKLPSPSFGLKNGLKILSGFGKLAINAFPIWSYLNFAEKQADENVIDDIEVLEGAARFMRRYAPITDPKNLSLQERLKRLADTHEDNLKRAQRFEERAAKLKNSKA